MKVAVWDTYVTRKSGHIMHFDILVPEEIRDKSIIHEFGKQYLISKDEGGQSLTTKECQFCHIETATKEMVVDIEKKGFFIVEMENCD